MISKLNHLSSLGLVQPQLVTDLMVELMAYQRGGNTLESLLSKLPTKFFEDDTEFMWDVVGSARRNLPLVEARRMDGAIVESTDTTPVGANGEPFYLVFAEDMFAKGEVIHGNLGYVYPIRIQNMDSAIRYEGTNTVYLCEDAGGNVQGIPVERLLAGERFSVGFAPVSKELSRKAGDRLFNVTILLIAV